MTDYTDNLEATEQEPTPEFYILTSGSTVERYTSYSRTLTFLGQTFTAASLARTGLKQDTKFAAVRMTITSPITPNIAKYIPNQPIEPTEVSVYRSHIDHLDQYEIIFKGRIKQVQLKDKLASAMCESRNKVLITKIPKVIYQSYCNHDVFDDDCKLNATNYMVQATVLSITMGGYAVSFTYHDIGETKPSPYFRGGNIKFGSDLRLITLQVGSNGIRLHIPFDSRLKVGSTIYLYPGCDGSPYTCINKYNNLTNFLAMPYIPDTNPVIWGFK